MEKQQERNDRLVKLYQGGMSMKKIARQEFLTVQRVGAILRDNMPNYKPKERYCYLAKKTAPCEQVLTENQQVKYEVACRVYAFYCKNVAMEYKEIGSVFGLTDNCIRDKLKRMQQHLETGDPYFPPRKKVKRYRTAPIKHKVIPKVANPRVKDPDSIWKAAYEAGNL